MGVVGRRRVFPPPAAARGVGFFLQQQQHEVGGLGGGGLAFSAQGVGKGSWESCGGVPMGKKWNIF